MTYMRVIYVYHGIFITGSISPQLRPRQHESAHHWNRISFYPNSRGRGLNSTKSFSVADPEEGGSGTGSPFLDQTKARKVEEKIFWDHPHPPYLKVGSATGVSKGCAREQLHSVSCGRKAGRSPFFKICNFAGPGYTSQVFGLTNKTPPFPQIKDEKMAPYGSVTRLQSCLRGFDFPKIVGFMRFWDFTCVNKMEAMWERWLIITLK